MGSRPTRSSRAAACQRLAASVGELPPEQQAAGWDAVSGCYRTVSTLPPGRGPRERFWTLGLGHFLRATAVLTSGLFVCGVVLAFVLGVFWSPGDVAFATRLWYGVQYGFLWGFLYFWYLALVVGGLILVGGLLLYFYLNTYVATWLLGLLDAPTFWLTDFLTDTLPAVALLLGVLYGLMFWSIVWLAHGRVLVDVPPEALDA